MDILEAINKVEKIDLEDDEEIRQIFPCHTILSERLRKSLYYGESLPSTDRSSYNLTEICVDQFTHGLNALEFRLDLGKAAGISRDTCASPTSFLLALLYLDRLRNTNPEYLNNVSSTQVFLVSLMVASKFLNDDGEEDEVLNDEWAQSAGLDTERLNALEIQFLTAIDWKIFVSVQEFDGVLNKVERKIAEKYASKRGWTTYTDLAILSERIDFIKSLSLLYECVIKVTLVCVSAYTASLVAMTGTCCLLNGTPVGPRAVRQLLSPAPVVTSSADRSAFFEPLSETPDVDFSPEEKDVLTALSTALDESPFHAHIRRTNGTKKERLIFDEGYYCRSNLNDGNLYRCMEAGFS